jgi:hypothetical protein
MKPIGTESLPLFEGTRSAIQVGLDARDAAAARHADKIAALVPIAHELAEKVGVHGITVSDIRIVAVQRGILSGQEKGRDLSYLSAVPPAAGLEPTGEYRRSVIVKTHGNLQQSWRLPAFGRAPKCARTRDDVSGAA